VYISSAALAAVAGHDDDDDDGKGDVSSGLPAPASEPSSTSASVRGR